jgi:hypothetical protein
MGIAAPMISSMMKDRKVREAARELSTFIMLAKARATETGRPAGVIIVRDNDNQLPNSAYQVFLCESPPPFVGEFLNARVVLDPVPSGSTIVRAMFNPPQSIITATPNFVQPGDLIRLDYKGPIYEIISANDSEVQFKARDGMNPPIPGNMTVAPGVPFQIYRQPVPASGNPLELPIGVVVDLEYSGVGLTGRETAVANGAPNVPPITITFQPTGGVDRVFGINATIPSTIHLLVGRVEQISALQIPADPVISNISDPTTFWVSIGHLTGHVTTAENVGDGQIGVAFNPASLTSARSIAQSKQAMGGR